MSDIATVEVETGPNPVGSVIWLHGLGADGHDFEPIVPEFALPDSLPLRFVFPHAPERPVTVNGGMVMRAWYDIVSLDFEGRADADGIRSSSEILDRLVEDELERGINIDNIVIAGFSQGGAVALHNVLERDDKPAGLIAISTYLALPNEPGRADGVPAFMAHGTFDPMVPFFAGQQSAAALERKGAKVEWHDYPMAHGVCPQEIRDIREWLLGVYSA
ncbi:MAG: carboxylesterase [Woeseiaceae bacterium]|nr:carboxylesterase [Woeseiaceae bacterium]